MARSLNGWSLNGWSLYGLELSTAGASTAGASTAWPSTAPCSAAPRRSTANRSPAPASTLSAPTSSWSTMTRNIPCVSTISSMTPPRPRTTLHSNHILLARPERRHLVELCIDAHGDPTAAIPIANHSVRCHRRSHRRPRHRHLRLSRRRAGQVRRVGLPPLGHRRVLQGPEVHDDLPRRPPSGLHPHGPRWDYCGEGLPHTINDTPIDILDRLSPTIQGEASSGAEGWGVEAEWGPDGALCIGESLRLHMLEEARPGAPAGPVPRQASRPATPNSPARDAKLVKNFPRGLDGRPRQGSPTAKRSRPRSKGRRSPRSRSARAAGRVAVTERVGAFRRRYFISGEINSEVTDQEARMRELADLHSDAEVSWLDGVSVVFHPSGTSTSDPRIRSRSCDSTSSRWSPARTWRQSGIRS